MASYYNIPKARFYLLKRDYSFGEATLRQGLSGTLGIELIQPCLHPNYALNPGHFIMHLPLYGLKVSQKYGTNSISSTTSGGVL